MGQIPPRALMKVRRLKLTLLTKLRGTSQMRQWRELVISHGRCKCCRATDQELEADHIVPLSEMVKRFNLKSLADARSCGPLWYVRNGQALCHPCHVEKTYEDAEKYGWDQAWVFSIMGPRLGSSNVKRRGRINHKPRAKLSRIWRPDRQAAFDAKVEALAENPQRKALHQYVPKSQRRIRTVRLR